MAEVMARIESVSTPSGLFVFRNDEMGFDQFPFVVVLDGGHQVADDQELNSDRVFMEVLTVLGVSPAHDVNLGTALNELHENVVTALISDSTLNGLGEIEEVEMGDIILGDEDGKGHSAVAPVTFSVEYSQERGDPSAVIPNA